MPPKIRGMFHFITSHLEIGLADRQGDQTSVTGIGDADNSLEKAGQIYLLVTIQSISSMRLLRRPEQSQRLAEALQPQS